MVVVPYLQAIPLKCLVRYGETMDEEMGESVHFFRGIGLNDLCVAKCYTHDAYSNAT